METTAHSVQELFFVDTLERALELFLVESRASIWSFAALLDVLGPDALRGDLRQREVAVHGRETGFEDAVREEELDVKLARNGALCTSVYKVPRLLERLVERICSFLR